MIRVIQPQDQRLFEHYLSFQPPARLPPRLPARTRQPSPEVREETKMRWGWYVSGAHREQAASVTASLPSPSWGTHPAPVGLWFLLVGSGGLEHCGQGRTPPPMYFPEAHPPVFVVQPPAAEEARPIGRWCFCFSFACHLPSPQLMAL